jgi:hypothetical protein
MEQAFMSLAGGGLSSMFSGGSGMGTMMQGGASALSALSSITAGRVARNEGEQAARMSFYAADFARDEGRAAQRSARLDARQEEIAGRATATALQEDLVQTLGAQRVAFAASGGDVSSGTAGRLQEQAAKRAADDIALEKSNTRIRTAQALIRGSTAKRQADLEAMTLEAEAGAYSRKGKNAQTAGYLEAASTAFKFGASAFKRK